MRIELHHAQAVDGGFEAVHIVHTERVEWNRLPDPRDVTKMIDMIDFLALCDKDPTLCKTAGWDRISNHPKHEGKTHLQIVKDEVSAARDTDACLALGLPLQEVPPDAGSTE